MMERYLVTGGAGFIGSHLVETLLKAGHFVRVIDNFDTGKRENINAFSGELEIVEGSIVDPQMVASVMQGIDFVFHEAARGSVPRSVNDPVGTHEANITGTLNILVAARDAKVKRVVCASSSSVYGETPTLPKKETMMPTPKSPYALSKLTTEYYCNVFSQVYGLETVALRYFNIYGPRQNPLLQYAAVIPIFISNMLQQLPCIIYGDGEQTRDFTFVEDCVNANLLACTTQGISGNFYNIACGKQTSVNQLFQLLSEILDNKAPADYQPVRAGDVKYSYASIKKAKNEMGFKPAFRLKKGLKKTVQWYKKQLGIKK
jgi:UDP-N-acetylglucosamine/UDP-N-acetyl-alpha-D-glucosaminouronate 4-epimerase